MELFIFARFDARSGWENTFECRAEQSYTVRVIAGVQPLADHPLA